MSVTLFSALPLSQDLQDVVRELGFEKTTPIQAESIPVLLSGKDLIGQAQTGSGKTAAFTLPILQKINLQRREIQAVILCPTRELCTQVAREVRKLARKHVGLQVLILSGGQPLRPQAMALRKGVHLIVGTPGRVLDHISRRNLDFRYVSTLVLDEADRMLDMGFEEDMAHIIEETPKTRQTVFFSATFPPSIEQMSQQYQIAPVRVTVAALPEEKPSIQQFVIYEPDEEQKIETLLRIFK